jgi:HSP20 family protein
MMAESKELQAKGKVAVLASAELTKPGPVFTPNVDIFETEKEIIMLAEMIDQKKIDAALNNGVLRLTLPKVEKAMPRQITVKAE